MSAIFTYSQDILYLVLAFCILWLTVFLVWFVYYLIATIRQVHHLTRDFKRRFDQVDSLIQAAKDKIERSASYLSIIVDGVKKIVEITQAKEPVKRSAKKPKTPRQPVE